MSRAAQAMEQFRRDREKMRQAERRQGRRMVNQLGGEQDVATPGAASSGQPSSTNQISQTGTEAGMETVESTNTKQARAGRSKKSQAPKTAKAVKKPRAAGDKPTKKPTFETLPDVSELSLVKGGLGSKADRNRYINLEFTNGYSVRLLPIGFPKGQSHRVKPTRDLIVAWLRKGLRLS